MCDTATVAGTYLSLCVCCLPLCRQPAPPPFHLQLATIVPYYDHQFLTGSCVYNFPLSLSFSAETTCFRLSYPVWWALKAHFPQLSRGGAKIADRGLAVDGGAIRGRN